jgi:hypothetical protein
LQAPLKNGVAKGVASDPHDSSVAGSFSYKKRWFLGLKHTTPRYSQNKILAVKNLEKSLRTSAFGGEGFYTLFQMQVVLQKSVNAYKYHSNVNLNLFKVHL